MKDELRQKPVLAMYDVRGIQGYIFSTNRIKDIIGASELVENIIIDGLQVIAERQYAVDPEGTIDASSGEVFLASARVYLFDSPESAESTWDTLVAAESVEADLPDDDDSFSYEKTELEDVGDRATVLNLSAEISEDETGVFRTIIVQ